MLADEFVEATLKETYIKRTRKLSNGGMDRYFAAATVHHLSHGQTLDVQGHFSEFLTATLADMRRKPRWVTGAPTGPAASKSRASVNLLARAILFGAS